MSQNEKVLLNNIKNMFKIDGEIQRDRRVWIHADNTQLLELCSWIKDQGFIHLSAISVTDWLEKGNFELTYHLWSYTDKILLTIKTNISRRNPKIPSVSSIWHESAQIHERELHELFGVVFEGNHDLAPLFLEEWNTTPPFRKDFDWRDFVRKEYYSKENEREVPYYD